MARILIVDDDEDVRKLMGLVLQEAGHHVVSTANGKDAGIIHQESSIDLMITDILMPDCDGIEVIRAIRRSAPHLKIIAISGGGASDASHFLEMASRLGANETFSKPINWEKMLYSIDKLTNADQISTT